MLDEKIQSIKDRAAQAIEKAPSSPELYDIKVQFLGKKGELTLLMRELGKIDKEERPAFGQKINAAKNEVEALYDKAENSLKKKELDLRLKNEKIDMTLPGTPVDEGSKHPIDWVMEEIVGILARLGYSVRTGAHIEHDRYNFEALNIPANHPARDMQDTFYIDEHHVLRTHTSPIQIHTLENEKPPLRVIAPGGVFRCDHDVSHSPNFHQIELMLVDRKASMADLKRDDFIFCERVFWQPN